VLIDPASGEPAARRRLWDVLRGADFQRALNNVPVTFVFYRFVARKLYTVLLKDLHVPFPWVKMALSGFSGGWQS